MGDAAAVIALQTRAGVGRTGTQIPQRQYAKAMPCGDRYMPSRLSEGGPAGYVRPKRRRGTPLLLRTLRRTDSLFLISGLEIVNRYRQPQTALPDSCGCAGAPSSRQMSLCGCLQHGSTRLKSVDAGLCPKKPYGEPSSKIQALEPDVQGDPLLAENRRSNRAAYALQATNVRCDPFSEATPC